MGKAPVVILPALAILPGGTGSRAASPGNGAGLSLLDKLKERERHAAEMRRKALEAIKAYEEGANRNKLAVVDAIGKALGVWKDQLDVKLSVDVSEYQWRRRLGFSGSDAVVQVSMPDTSWYCYYQVIAAERWIRVNAATQAPNQNARTRKMHPEHLIVRPEQPSDPALQAFVQKIMKMFFWAMSRA